MAPALCCSALDPLLNLQAQAVYDAGNVVGGEPLGIVRVRRQLGIPGVAALDEQEVRLLFRCYSTYYTMNEAP